MDIAIGPLRRLHVPPEISYIILEHLCMPMEKETIKALCLTARDFWNPCQRVLFTIVDIATTWSSAHVWQSPVSRLFAAFTINPSLASTTRHLACCCKWEANRDCPEDVSEHLIFQLLPLFRRAFCWIFLEPFHQCRTLRKRARYSRTCLPIFSSRSSSSAVWSRSPSSLCQRVCYNIVHLLSRI